MSTVAFETLVPHRLSPAELRALTQDWFGQVNPPPPRAGRARPADADEGPPPLTPAELAEGPPAVRQHCPVLPFAPARTPPNGRPCCSTKCLRLRRQGVA